MWGPTSLKMFYPMVRRGPIFAVNIDIPHQKISEAEELRIALDHMIVNDSHLFFEGSAGSGLNSQCTKGLSQHVLGGAVPVISASLYHTYITYVRTYIHTCMHIYIYIYIYVYNVYIYNHNYIILYGPHIPTSLEVNSP